MNWSLDLSGESERLSYHADYFGRNYAINTTNNSYKKHKKFVSIRELKQPVLLSTIANFCFFIEYIIEDFPLILHKCNGYLHRADH